jgi:hypothetical protein
VAIAILGQTKCDWKSVMLDDRPFTIIGVMPDRLPVPVWSGVDSPQRDKPSRTVGVWIAEYRPLRSRLSGLVGAPQSRRDA